MSLSQSNLTESKYDVVVATTQASINSTLKQYLATISQPQTEIVFLADDNGNPSNPMSLNDFLDMAVPKNESDPNPVDNLEKRSAINPFDIPDGTLITDSRIQQLIKYKFVAAIKIKVGLPDGIIPSQLPPIVSLGNSASNVTFRLFCNELTIVQIEGGGLYGTPTWSVYSQPQGQSWHFKTTVNLKTQALTKELNTPYFNNNPQQKQALLAKINNLSATAFSIQQLLFDLDNAALQSIPNIVGIKPGSPASIVLNLFPTVYFPVLKTHGEPLLAVKVVVNTPDPGTLEITGINREVDVYVDANGAPIPNPTQQQKDVTTLCYVCATNNNPLPTLSSFNWNWVDENEVDLESGVIAINREVIANYFLNQLMLIAKNCCLFFDIHITAHMLGSVDISWGIGSQGTPQIATINPTGSNIVTISYYSATNKDDKSGLTYAECDINTTYSCNVTVQNNTITIVQFLEINAFYEWDTSVTSWHFTPYSNTITDTYEVSVGANGELQIIKTNSVQSNPYPPQAPDGVFEHGFDATKLFNNIQTNCEEFISTDFTSIPVNDLQNFIFPGGQVFAFKDVQFSDNQDLVARITYQAPQ